MICSQQAQQSWPRAAARGVEPLFMTAVRTYRVFDPTLAGGNAAVRARADLNGCPWHDVKSMLRQVGLRPTRQRMALGWILFAKGDRHLTAEMLYEEATKAKVPVSLATVYNTLHQFTEVGLLRQVAVDGSKTYFDTNVSAHHHFFVEGDNALRRYPGRRGDASASCRRRRPATRSPASTWWCGCARTASIPIPKFATSCGRFYAQLSESRRTLASLSNLVWLWFRSPHLGLAANIRCGLLNRHTGGSLQKAHERTAGAARQFLRIQRSVIVGYRPALKCCSTTARYSSFVSVPSWSGFRRLELGMDSAGPRILADATCRLCGDRVLSNSRRGRLLGLAPDRPCRHCRCRTSRTCGAAQAGSAAQCRKGRRCRSIRCAARS